MKLLTDDVTCSHLLSLENQLMRQSNGWSARATDRATDPIKKNTQSFPAFCRESCDSVPDCPPVIAFRTVRERAPLMSFQFLNRFSSDVSTYLSLPSSSHSLSAKLNCFFEYSYLHLINFFTKIQALVAARLGRRRRHEVITQVITFPADIS